jgi:hypothetical protein
MAAGTRRAEANEPAENADTAGGECGGYRAGQGRRGNNGVVGAYAVFGWWWADPLGALAMLPVILWQGWETLIEAGEAAANEN